MKSKRKSECDESFLRGFACVLTVKKGECGKFLERGRCFTIFETGFRCGVMTTKKEKEKP
ncbi:hypothetical protein [Fidelibacter multiformis]|jgi:hypothetical protein|uniref:hypothetical protein n=1 Tax=Fidelibacter multiformis TaxID=3377529 RepID=UPI0037DCC4D5